MTDRADLGQIEDLNQRTQEDVSFEQVGMWERRDEQAWRRDQASERHDG